MNEKDCTNLYGKLDDPLLEYISAMGDINTEYIWLFNKAVKGESNE